MTVETYGLISLIPALLAILLTLVTRQVLLSLFAGIWIGATVITGWNPAAGATRSLQFVVDNVTEAFNIKLLLFTFLIGAMLGMIFLSGGMTALATQITKRIRTRRQAAIGTSLLGMTIFVDSYASTMITGSVMRPITDKFDISREKLAYILDSTTSPTASLSVVSTWLGFEVGLIAEQLNTIGAAKYHHRGSTWSGVSMSSSCVSIIGLASSPMSLPSVRARRSAFAIGPKSRSARTTMNTNAMARRL